MDVLTRAKKAAMNTNFLDNKKRRIYLTSRGYNPTPKYTNIPGSKVVTRLP